MNNNINPILRTDSYKTGHIKQYPEGTEQVFSNWTPRDSRHAPKELTKMTWFGLQAYLLETMVKGWNESFFYMPKDEVIDEYVRVVSGMGLEVFPEQFGALHDLGYLPLEIRSLPEGVEVDMGIPTMVMWNTLPEFYWLTNFIETDMSANLWLPCTSASTATLYRRIMSEILERTGCDSPLFDFAAHDFSYRGMSSTQSAMVSGGAHLTAWNGTDSIPSIRWVENNYGATLGDDLIAGSVPATEHSVMCAGSKAGEEETYQRLLDMYPDTVISIVSDTWDYWNVLTNILPKFKDQIMSRELPVVIRPDSGNPVDIICGDPKAAPGSPSFKGSFELLYETFGGSTNDKGFVSLAPQIGLIYGDSITPERARMIYEGLAAKNFCPTVVLGIGSYTYQFATRDTFGNAIKATSIVVNGERQAIFKDPVTAKGGLRKKSAVGLTAVYLNEDSGEYQLVDGVEMDAVKNCAFELRFKDGVISNLQQWSDIVDRVRA